MFKSERTFDMSSFGWEDCKFTFKALSWKEQRDLDDARIKWSTATEKKDTDKAALEIFDIMKKQFVRGQALNDEGNKTDVKPEDFEQLPFDVFLKLVAWVTSGEVDEAFLVK